MRIAALTTPAVLLLFLIADAGESDGLYYYSLDSAVNIGISNRYVVIQLDSNQASVTLEEFQSAHTVFNNNPPTPLGRNFWRFELTIEIPYDSAQRVLALDAAVNRIIPVYMAADDDVGFCLTDEITVRFADDLDRDSVVAVLSAEGLHPVDSSDYAHNLWYCALDDSIRLSPLEFGNRLHERPETRWACAVPRVEATAFATALDPYFANQYYLKNTGQGGGAAGTDIAAEDAWRVFLADSTLVVAIIDYGIEAHTDLPAGRLLPGRDFVGDGIGIEEQDDDPRPGYWQGHGMAVAGIMAGSHNDVGIMGVFGSCHVIPVKIFGDNGAGTRPEVLAEAIRYAGSQGAKVIANSWGYHSQTPFTVIEDAIRDVTNGNCGTWGAAVMVFSAGNDGSTRKVVFPANMPEVIAVGAITKSNGMWYYSNTGAALDVVAPSGLHTLYLGDQWTLDREGTKGWNPDMSGPYGDIGDVDYTATMGGTSGACPQVAGIAALLLARGVLGLDACNPGPLIRDIICRSAIDVGAFGLDTVYGWGRANAYQALLSIMRGDVDNSGAIDDVDVAMEIDIVFFGQSSPLDNRLADVTGSGGASCDGYGDATDLAYLIDYVFFGGPAPAQCYVF